MNIGKTLKLALKKVLSLQFGAVDTDKGRLIWDGSEDLKEGDEVFVEVEGEDEPQTAESGSYKTEDGKTIIVVDGVVSEIQDPEAEVADEDKAEEVEAAEEEELPAPVDEAEKEEETNEEDRFAILEEKVNAIVDGLNQIVNSIAALESRIAELEGKMASIEAPAADPVADENTIEEKKTRLSYLRRD